MASTAAERQKKRLNNMLENGYKRRAFYITEDALEQLRKYKEKHELQNLDEALNQILKALK